MFEGVPNGDNITIAELLKMRSGLYNYTAAPELAESLDRDPTKVWTPEELLAIAFKRPPYFAPGTEFDYCNTNYALLGLIAEKLEGKPLAKIFQDRLFGPLGMKHTLLPCQHVEHHPRSLLAWLFVRQLLLRLGGCALSRRSQAAAKAGTLKPNDDTWQNPSYAYGGRRRHLDRRRSRHLDARAGRRQSFQCRLLSASGSTASSRKIQASPTARNTGTASPSSALDRTRVFSRRRDARLQLVHGLRSSQRVTLIIWTNLTVSLDGQPTANTIMLKVLDQIYAVSPLQ